jgi:cytochrome c-type biogenesis protein
VDQVEWYELVSRWSAELSQPFSQLFYQTQIPILGAILLGMVGALAPCQISANIGAITYFSQRSVHEHYRKLEMVLYIIGKVVVYSILGLLVFLLGNEISNESIPLFAWSRKFMGPLFVIVGLIFIGLIRPSITVGIKLSEKVEKWALRFGPNQRAFWMGAAFSLGFCPTMFWVFFGLLIPLALPVSYGFLLPSVFAVGTVIPLLLFFTLTFGFGLDRWFITRAKKWGHWVQLISGIIFILVGISDILAYW